MPRNSAPISAPTTVPEPPASSVPPMTAAEMPSNRTSLAPDGSGWTELVRTASRIPTSAAHVLHRMKLRMITIRTLIPASAAPRRLPPTATVYRPQRVRLSTTCSTSTTSSAQMSSE
jgi:hypothetical protein